MKERTPASVFVILILLVMFSNSVHALTLERPCDIFPINQRVDNATTNNEITTGVGVNLWEYEENHEIRGDNVELIITGTANSRGILNYGVSEDSFCWHNQFDVDLGQLYLGDNEIILVNLDPNLGKPIRFYGGPGSFEYDALWVCSNGWISFYDPQQSQPIPDTKILIPHGGQANAVVAPFSRDLKPNWGGQIRCGYVYHTSASIHNCWCFCISWEDVPDKDSIPQSFQILIRAARSWGVSPANFHLVPIQDHYFEQKYYRWD